MPRLLFFIPFLFASCSGIVKESAPVSGKLVQQHTIDSLHLALGEAKEDTSKVTLLNQLGWELRSDKPDTSIILCTMALNLATENSRSFVPAISQAGLKGLAKSNQYLGMLYEIKGSHAPAFKYTTKALSLMNGLNDKEGQAAVLNILGAIYSRKGNNKKAFELYVKAIQINEVLGNKSGVANNLCNIGGLYTSKGNCLIGLEYYFKSLKLAEEIGNKKTIAGDLSNIGGAYSIIGNYQKAIDYEFRALKMQEQIGDKGGIALTLSAIGFIFQQQNNKPKALTYYLNALQKEEELGNKSEKAHNLGDIAQLYTEQKAYSKALRYQLQALKLSEEEHDKPEMCYRLCGIGSIFAGQGDSARQQGNVKLAVMKYSQAIVFFSRSLELSRQINDKHTIATDLSEIGFLKMKLGKYDEAFTYLSQALAIAEKTQEPVLLENFHKGLSELYSLKGDDKKALEHYKKYSVLKDSLYVLEKNTEITRKEMSYEFDKKEAFLKATQEKKEILHDKEKQRYLIIIYFGIGATILIFILGFVLYRNKMQRMRTSHLQAELRFLKDQINPHFLFNILNSIYVLVQTDTERASAIILKLSSMLRYQLYDCVTDLVPLKEEIAFINDYLELQKIRSAHKLQLNFTQSGCADDLFIAPLVLITFVENAFKFGVEPANSGAFINIHLAMESSEIQFRIENSIPEVTGKPVKGGIGLQNVQRRLDLLYPGKHTFTKFYDPGRFVIELSINAS
jgi:tetratricopeptide (TPR) repeat protein